MEILVLILHSRFSSEGRRLFISTCFNPSHDFHLYKPLYLVTFIISLDLVIFIICGLESPHLVSTVTLPFRIRNDSCHTTTCNISSSTVVSPTKGQFQHMDSGPREIACACATNLLTHVFHRFARGDTAPLSLILEFPVDAFSS